MTTPAVHVSRDGTVALFQPKSYLGSELFDVYRRAIEGSRYRPDKRANAAGLDKVPSILVRLREAGFDVWIDRELREALQERNVQQWLDHASVKERIERVDAEVRATNKKKGRDNGLFPYQRTGAMWLSMRHTALLADDMGLGKTLQAIVALPAGAPTLVVCPAALKGTWVGEFEKWRPQLKTEILQGRNGFRWPKEGEILIINYDVLPQIHDVKGVKGRICEGFLEPEPCPGCKEELVFVGSIVTTKKDGHVPSCTGYLPPKKCMGCAPVLDRVMPGTVGIFDELHKTKSGRSAMGMRLRAIARALRGNSGRTWGLTGTPMENDPRELWYVMDAAGVADECFGGWKSFTELFKGRPLDHGNYAWGLPDGEVVERIRRGCLRRMKSEVLPELPAKMWQEVLVSIDAKSIAKCDSFLRDMGGIERLTELLEQEKIPFEKMSSVRAALATAKIPALLDIVQELSKSGEPIVVYSMHRAPIEALAKLKGWEVILGGQKDRESIVKRFQDGKLRGLGVTIETGGEGLTLTRSRLGIFVDLSFKPTQNTQAEDRQVRIGQDRGVRFIIMKADHPLDRRVTEILLKKRELIAVSVDAASVADDAPGEAEKGFEAELRKMSEEIASGRAVRHPAVTDEERAVLEELHALKFANTNDERIALRLAEEAVRIGLSGPQWTLAADIAKRGRTALVTARDENKDGEEAAMTDEQASELVTKIEAVLKASPSTPETTVAGVLAWIRAMTPFERGELFGAMGATFEMDDKERRRFLVAVLLVESLSSKLEDRLMRQLSKEFCVDCGEENSDDHECEEDEDEDDEEDLDDELGSEPETDEGDEPE